MSSATRELRETQLLQQARYFFSASGYEATSVQEIADALGITRPLFYYYFHSKEELLWRLIGELGDELLEQARGVVAAEEKPIGMLQNIVKLHVGALLANSEAFNIYFAERRVLTGERAEQMLEGELEYLGLISDVISKAQEHGDLRDGDPHVLALLVTGLANSVLRWYSPEGDLTREEICELVGETAIGGLKGSRLRRKRLTA
jgi:TetR/AcrR family transcriptional regulator, cholesterol catabolism regulator